MPAFFSSKPVIITLVILAALILLALSQFIYIKLNGTPVPAPQIPRDTQEFTTPANDSNTDKQTKPLKYAVLGDSTTISQGGDYKQGYAVQSAKHLAKTHAVTFKNFGVSGARAKDVAQKQIPYAVEFKPDVVLIAVGANDVTHFTNIQAVEVYIHRTVKHLRQANPDVKIVITGSPDMGSVTRLPQPSRWVAGLRTESMNAALKQRAIKLGITFAPVADKTGPIFRAQPELFAQDNFHPTTDGYKTWVPVITDALDQALTPAKPETT